MALLFCEGFDDGLTATKWNAGAGNTYPAGRNGNCLECSGTSEYIDRSLPNVSTIIVGFAFKQLSNPGQMLTLYGDAGATQHITVKIESNGTFTVRRGSVSGTTIIATTASILADVWHYVELKATIADAGGIAELRLDGRVVGTYTGDTRNGGTGTVFDKILFPGNGAGSLNYQVDDIYVCDGTGAVNNDFLGDIKVETLLPNGNGNSSQLVGSDGNSVDNYLLVDEATPSTADYVASGTIGQKDTYTFANLAATSGPVKGVYISAYANKTDAGARDIINVTRSGATEADSASMTLQTTYTTHSSVQETDPNGGGGWTIAGVNAAEFGVKVN